APRAGGCGRTAMRPRADESPSRRRARIPAASTRPSEPRRPRCRPPRARAPRLRPAPARSPRQARSAPPRRRLHPTSREPSFQPVSVVASSVDNTQGKKRSRAMAAVRRGAWVALKYVTSIFFLGVILQFFFVGFGLFGMKDGETIDNAKSLDAHRAFGFILADGGAILLLVLALLAWPTPRKVLGAWILLALLAFFQ